MNRYLLLILSMFLSAALEAQGVKHVAITIDNLPVAGKEVGLNWTQGSNYMGVEALQIAKIPLVGFVNEHKVIPSKEKEARTAILSAWLAAGAELANGTFSNIPLGQAQDEAWFEQDVLYGERIIRSLIKSFEDTLRYFRFPNMDIGTDTARLDSMNAFLKQNKYTPVTATIRFDDELFNTPYINAKIERDSIAEDYIIRRYFEYFTATLDHYEKASTDNFSRQITHIISLRSSHINNFALGYLFSILWQRGYRFVTLEEALDDPLYKKHLPERYRGGFFWDYAQGVAKDAPPQPATLIKSLYQHQTY